MPFDVYIFYSTLLYFILFYSILFCSIEFYSILFCSVLFYSILIDREGTGIYIDENLDNGRTEHCRTFNNPPLASTKDFNISVIETIGFNNTEW